MEIEENKAPGFWRQAPGPRAKARKSKTREHLL